MAKAQIVSEAERQRISAHRRLEQIGEQKKYERERDGRAGLWSRRDFFGRLSWGGLGAVSLVGMLAFIWSAFPRVLFLSPSTFRAGYPTDYPVGEVSEKYKQEFRVWIVHIPQGFYALSANCTHLGCTPRWISSENKYKCPCHGSGYYKSGYNFEGPAPRPMDRFALSLDETGEFVVDKSTIYVMQPGIDPDKQHPESILKG